jgi:glycogen debranching enzyme
MTRRGAGGHRDELDGCRPITFIRPEQLCAWRGPSLLIVDARGECGARDGLSGFYFRESRFLRTLRPTINGQPPWCCDATSLEPRALQFTFVHPELTEFGGGGSGQSTDIVTLDAHGVPHRSQAIRLHYVLGLSGLDASLRITNHARQPVEYDVAWDVDADFADLEEAHAGTGGPLDEVTREVSSAALMLTYRHSTLELRTIISSRDVPLTFSDRHASARIVLSPGETRECGLRVDVRDSAGAAAMGDEPAATRQHEHWRAHLTTVTCARSSMAEAIVRRAVDDFASLPMLDGAPDEWLACQAGVPLYPAIFGRDAVTAGWQAAMLDRGESLNAALTLLGRQQSTSYDEWRDAEPGRIPHSLRRGRLARLHATPYGAYYGDMAGPLMFVIALAHLYSWTGETAVVRRHWDTARRVLDWARTDGDRDQDGYLEYRTRSPRGPKNQGWKDSGDSVVHDDGTDVPAPIATCELQGYWFAAQQLMAVLAVPMARFQDARSFWRDAAALKARFNRDWWLDDEESIALAMDPDKRLVRAATSNMGHCLAAGIVSDEHIRPVVGRLFAPDLFSGWGVRTLSAGHRYYDPLSYHRGSVWPVEQSTIAFGLRRFGFVHRANELMQATFELASHYPGYRLPECVGGYGRGEARAPGAYPRANPIQLWNVAAIPLMLHAMLGLQPVAPLETLVVDPALPAWLPEVVLHDLRLAGAVATIRFWRDDRGRSHAEVMRKRGTFRLVRQPPPESLTAGLRDRMSALVDTLVH